MYNQKLCLSASSTFGMYEPEQIKLFKKIGFEGVTVCTDNCQTVRDCAQTAKDEGMIFQSYHAPWNRTADMWDEDKRKSAQKGVSEFCEYLEMCAELNIPMMITHVFVGFDKPCVPTEFGLENYGKVIDRAEQLGIEIAFENTEGEEGLHAVFNTFGDRKNVGFCWDSGHEMCYNRSEDLLALYGDRLIATHINDNLGIKAFDGTTTWHDDLHLLPFDGIADWEYNADRLAKCGFDRILTFELNNVSKPNRHENDKYFKMPIEEYLSEAYAGACRFAAMLNRSRAKQKA